MNEVPLYAQDPVMIPGRRRFFISEVPLFMNPDAGC